MFGGWRGRPDSPVPFQWTSNKIKVLGTFIGNGNLEEPNWCPLIDAVAKCVSAWSSRNLSYGGRALISNALAPARVWYMATMLPIPGWALGKLNRIIFFFRRAKKTWLPVPWSSSLEVVAASTLLPLTSSPRPSFFDGLNVSGRRRMVGVYF